MAQPRRRVGRSRRGGPRLSWWVLLLLVLIGAAVVAGRSMGRSRPEAPRSEEPRVLASRAPTATSLATHAFQPVAAAPTKPPPNAELTPATLKTPTPAGATRTQASVASPTRTPAATRTPTAAPLAPAAARTPTAAPLAPTAATVASTSTPATGPSSSAEAGASVALTFDAGADRGFTEDILDILQDEHVVASFGITGQWARANPDLARRMAADGHLVFNHTLDHRSFTGLSDSLGGLSAARRRAELEDADAIIAPLIGHTTRPYYRLPYGDDDPHVAADVQPAGYSHKIGWTVDSLGWRGMQAADILARCLRLATPGGVYVFHVGHASQDALALPRLIRGLRERSFGFHRVDQG